MNKNTVKTSNRSRKGIEKTTNRNWQLISSNLKQWSLKDDSYILEEFYTNCDIPEQTWYDNLETNLELREAHNYALLRLGVNREKLAIKRNEGVNSTNSFILPHYFKKRWQGQIEDRAKLKTLEENTNEPKHIILGCLKDCCMKKDDK